MSWKQKILVVANQTVGSDELRRELRDRSAKGPTAVTLLLPHRPTEVAQERLLRAVAELRQDGLEVDGTLANPDPFLAVAEAWDPARYDEIIVSTLPTASSRWLSAHLPQRIERHTGALVTVVSGRARTAADAGAAAEPVVKASLSEAGNVITLEHTSAKFTHADVEAVLAALAGKQQAA